MKKQPLSSAIAAVAVVLAGSPQALLAAPPPPPEQSATLTPPTPTSPRPTVGLPPLDLAEVPASLRPGVERLVDAALKTGRLRVSVARAVGESDDPEAVWCVSSVEGHMGLTVFECIDATGEVADLDEAWSRFHRHRFERDGTMTPRLAAMVRERLAAGGPLSSEPLLTIAWARHPAALLEVPREPTQEGTGAEWAQAIDAVVADCQAVAAAANEACEIERFAEVPFVNVIAPPATLNTLSRKSTVGALSYASPEEWQTVAEANGNHFLYSGRFNVAQGYSPPVDGAGVAVGVLEGTQPRPGSAGAFTGWLDPSTDILCPSGISGFHSECVASVIASDPNFGTLNGGPRLLDGASPGVRLIMGNMGDFSAGDGHCAPASLDPTCDPTCGTEGAYVTGMNWVLGRGAEVMINANATGLTDSYHWLDRYTDWRANNPSPAPHLHYPTIVTVAGQSACQTAPGQSRNGCFNCLVVGAAADQDDDVRSNDAHGVLCDRNRGTGLEVPHVDAVGSRVRAIGGFSNNFPPNTITEGRWAASGSGVSTSWASPLVASLAAMAIGEIPALSQYPEAVRAVVMATATKDTDGVPLVVGDLVDDGDGAGLINAGVAARLLRTGAVNFWNTTPGQPAGVNYGCFNQSHFDPGTGYYNRWVAVKAPLLWVGQNLQATLTWNVDVTCSGVSGTLCPTATAPTSAGRYAIEVYDDIFQPPVAVSSVSQNHHNYVHVRTPAVYNTTYYVLIKREWLNPSPTSANCFGLAWSTFTTTEE